MAICRLHDGGVPRKRKTGRPPTSPTLIQRPPMTGRQFLHNQFNIIHLARIDMATSTVHHVEQGSEFDEFARQGKCVAIRRDDPVMLVGKPETEEYAFMSTTEEPAAQRLLKAIAFAAHKHRDQRRKGAEASPYINHPIAVANLLASTGGTTDIDVLCAAVLHDTIEDTETTFDELAAEFGSRVASVVREVTDDKSLPKDRRKQLQIEHAPHLSPEARCVKLADKICNVRDILASPPDWPLQRKQAYLDWAHAVVAGLRGANPALEAMFDKEIARKGDLTRS